MTILKSILEALAVGDAMGMPSEFMTQKAIDEVYPEINALLDPSKSHTHFELPYGSVTDDRMIDAMKYIRENGNLKMTCKAAADAVFLSESRFSHLFREQVGMTFAAYLIYQRILSVYTDVIRGKTVTEAAMEAGFSSSAHFADVNRRVFGISIRNISKDLNYIKVK